MANTMNGLDQIHERDLQYTYEFRGIPYVPHYNQQGVFVAPGGIEKKEHELAAMGAFKKRMYLWVRHYPKSRMVK